MCQTTFKLENVNYFFNLDLISQFQVLSSLDNSKSSESVLLEYHKKKLKQLGKGTSVILKFSCWLLLTLSYTLGMI